MSVETLSGRDLEAAARIYNTTVQMQDPPGYLTLSDAKQQLQTNFVRKRYYVFVNKNPEVNGIVIFNKFEGKFKIFFIGSHPTGKGTGKKLLKAIGDFAKEQHVDIVITDVSSRDKRALTFYQTSGFQLINQIEKEGYFEMRFKVDVKKLVKL